MRFIQVSKATEPIPDKCCMGWTGRLRFELVNPSVLDRKVRTSYFAYRTANKESFQRQWSAVATFVADGQLVGDEELVRLAWGCIAQAALR